MHSLGVLSFWEVIAQPAQSCAAGDPVPHPPGLLLFMAKLLLDDRLVLVDTHEATRAGAIADASSGSRAEREKGRETGTL